MTEQAPERRSTARTSILHVLVAAGLVAGCGGKHDTLPAGITDDDPEPAPRASGGGQVPPEKMDEINRDLERKRPVISRCIAQAVDDKELPKNSKGKVTLEIVIGRDGKAESVKVVRATLESKTLHECVMSHVREIQFPELSKPYETSYTYGFEAM